MNRRQRQAAAYKSELEKIGVICHKCKGSGIHSYAIHYTNDCFRCMGWGKVLPNAR